MTTTPTPSDQTAALVERLFNATIHALELYAVYLGLRLGLYDALADGRPRTSAELAGEAGIDERYAREWLEQQAVAGLIEVDDGSLDGARRRYRLAPAHASVLAAPEDPSYVAPFAPLVAGIGQALPVVVEAYRSGAGVPYADYGPDLRRGQGGINRPAFTHDLPGVWLPAIADVHARLLADPPAHVADLGCGLGWSTMAVARAYPKVRVDGIDADEASIAEARANLAADGAAGVAERVRFHSSDAADLARHGPYDLVLMLEMLHDLAQPVEVLAGARAALARDGSVLVADERVADRFTAPGDEVERMMYGWSVSHCLPAGMAERPSAATGTAMRPDTVRRYASEAGFAQVEVLPIDNELFRFYRLRA
jgi:2-polyprenyl-3-methyl-5-hydroxy-6-metoxy-1,4-benzoquinol methylase